MSWGVASGSLSTARRSAVALRVARCSAVYMATEGTRLHLASGGRTRCSRSTSRRWYRRAPRIRSAVDGRRGGAIAQSLTADLYTVRLSNQRVSAVAQRMTPSGYARMGRSACSRDTCSAQRLRTRRSESGLGSGALSQALLPPGVRCLCVR